MQIVLDAFLFSPKKKRLFPRRTGLTFKPTAEEIVEFTVPHLQTAPFPIVSFGQGCEGEPLLMWETIRESIIEIRKHTDQEEVSISIPMGQNLHAVNALCEAGLNSIRVSTNSARKHIYEAYYRPNNYVFEDIVESLKVVQELWWMDEHQLFCFSGHDR